MFVLAYHYLVIGQNDAAVKMLKEVVRLKPDDVTAKRMLETLDPPEDDPAATVAEEKPAEDGPTTDLVGNWTSDDKTPIKLTIDEQSQFTWQASPPGKPAVKLNGDLIASSDTIALETENEGTMIGRVRSGGPDKFTLLLQGMPAERSRDRLYAAEIVRELGSVSQVRTRTHQRMFVVAAGSVTLMAASGERVSGTRSGASCLDFFRTINSVVGGS